ncbi:polyphosphate polymerase domain-containing protein [Microbacterium sp. C7(2022)]|uniref:polyphosphate polymerase domain-containing protein n=1 Tax=Microbacterium sp. C7(2022) TaxID=2992759 RepID=UPI00237BF34F|nr:polyphosphate polymerase domain-containing protein [Microbacterium sp. C7(2022)]MDE0546241.1 polyphosphate polymerase domain-containing protein [Microbacterium sp. C7(2022)]
MSAAIERLRTLRTVSLEELNAQAALQTRVDRKYIVAAHDATAVLAALPRDAQVLEIDGERALRYASRYYDTPTLDSYLGAARGRRRRFKVRSRSYVDSGGQFLEVKTRGGRSATVKDRVPVATSGLDEAGVQYAAEMLADAGIPESGRIAERLQPTLETRYRRATLLLPGNETGGISAARATIDIDLAWADITGERMHLPGAVIIETKSGQRPGALDRTLWRHGHRPSSISKYGTGLAALRPALPSNKWRRVLSDHFADAIAA